METEDILDTSYILKFQTEKWKQIEQFPNYSASTFGRIRNDKTMYILTNINTQSYNMVCLNKRTKRVHQLIALTFIPNPENKKTVEHINGNKSDNRVINLTWFTHKEQASTVIRSHITSQRRRVKQYTMNNEYIKTFESIQLAKQETGCLIIGAVCKGQYKHGAGFIWKFDELILENEEWKEVFHKNVTFTVSNMGRVKSKNGRISYGNLGSENTYKIIKTDNKQCFVHVLVAKAFIPNNDPSKIVNHKDGNKTNNIVDNLEWITIKGNALHSIYILGNGISKKVLKIDINTGLVLTEFPSLVKAAETVNISPSCIKIACESGKIFKGFIWKLRSC